MPLGITISGQTTRPAIPPSSHSLLKRKMSYHNSFSMHHLQALCICWQKNSSGFWTQETTPENASPIRTETHSATELAQWRNSSSSGIFCLLPLEWLSDIVHLKKKLKKKSNHLNKNKRLLLKSWMTLKCATLPARIQTLKNCAKLNYKV